MQGMMGLGGGVPSRLLTLASGKITYVDDVFSTDLWSGNGTARNINTGLDMSGEGGMVWLKRRNGATNPMIYDTERGTYHLETDGTAAQSQFSQFLTGYRDDGYSIGTSLNINGSGTEAVGWSFRKCPGFFDVVTYTGNGTAGLSIPHSLGSVPGCIFIKNVSRAGTDWRVWHRSLTSNSYTLQLNTQSAEINSGTGSWNNTAPTSTHFTVGGDFDVNYNGDTHVAYIFAHNDGSFGEDSDEAVIKCDSYTGTQSEDTEINVGFEPQYLLIKNTSSGSTDWVVVDNMRGLPVGSDSEVLKANSNSTPASYRAAALTPTGFKLGQAVASVNGSGDTYTYIAIRRPHKQPSAGTDVLDIKQTTGNNVNGRHITGTSGSSPTDLHIIKRTSAGEPAYISSRLQGNLTYKASENEAAVSSVFGSSLNPYDVMNGIKVGQDGGMNSSSNTYISHFLSRKPGFMDVVIYKGASGAQTLNHNLGVTPEFIIIKKTSEASYYEATIYHGTTGNLFLNDQTSGYGGSNAVNHSTISATTFEVKSGNIDVNDDGETHAAYLFASLDGVSKVGSYSGTGSAQNIDCGFTNGARFVLIKRTDTADSWHLFDTVQGINSGADPYYRFDLSAAQVTGNDRIDPLDAGFTLADGDGGTNASGGTYFFLAIA